MFYPYFKLNTNKIHNLRAIKVSLGTRKFITTLPAPALLFFGFSPEVCAEYQTEEQPQSEE